MTDIQAAVGRVQFKRLPEILERRRSLAARYRHLLVQIPGLGLPVEPQWSRSNWQSYCFRLPETLEQGEVMQALLDAGIATRRGVMCAHREPAYPRGTWSCGVPEGDCACPPSACWRLRQSELAQDAGLILPLFHQMAPADQEAVVRSLEHAVVWVRV